MQAKPQAKGLDIDAVGQVNGTPIYEFDLEGLQADEKPWRKPGQSVTPVNFPSFRDYSCSASTQV